MTAALPKPRAVRLILFDAVGTLIYPEPSVAAVYHALAQRFGSQIPPDEIGRRFKQIQPQRGPLETDHDRERLRWRNIVAGVLDDVADIEPLFDELWNHFARGGSWRIYADVLAAWPELLALNIPLGVASNFDLRLHGVLRELDLPRLNPIFSSAEVGFSKPDSRFFRRIEELTRLQPHQILLVGDDLIADVAGATAAGWQCLFLSHPPAQHVQVELPCPKITSCVQIVPLLMR